MVMNVAASAPVRRGFGGQERDADAFGEGVGLLSVARSDEAGAGGAVVGCVVRAADLLEAEHELAELLFRASKGVDVTLGGGGGGAQLRSEPRPSATVWLYAVYTLSSYAWGGMPRRAMSATCPAFTWPRSRVCPGSPGARCL